MAEILQQESRVKKTLLNARVNLLFYFMQLILSFFSRKVFIDYLGSDFLGLIGTLGNLLGLLNLAELGIGTAIGFLLYKPLYEHNEEKINEIISVMGYYYKWIGLIILFCGLILSLFLPLIYPLQDVNAPLPNGQIQNVPVINYLIIYLLFYAFLASSLIGYFINYRQNLLGADQRNYIVTAYYKSMYIVKIVLQMVLAIYTRNLYFWIAVELSFGIIYSFVLNQKINKTYPWLKANMNDGKILKKKYPEVIKKTKQLFVHKIGGFVLSQVLPFLIYAFTSLSIVTYYQNYTVVTSKVSSFLANFLGGIGSSVGNLIAEGNIKKIISIFWELQSIRFFFAGLTTVPIYLLIDSFIKIWLGEMYILSNITLLFILFSSFIGIIRLTVEEFNFGFGLFADTWAPITESIILIVTSLIGGYFFGLNGVLFGSFLSTIIIVCIWKPYYLFHSGFKINFLTYWIHCFKDLGCIIISFIPTYFFMKFFDLNVSNFIKWSIRAVPIFFFYSVVSYITFYFFTSGMKYFHNRVKRIIKQKLISLRIYKS